MNGQPLQVSDIDARLDILDLFDRLGAANGALVQRPTPAAPTGLIRSEPEPEPEGWAVRFQALAELLPVQFLMLRANGSIECQSGEWRHYTGLLPGEENAWSWRDVVHRDDLSDFLNRWQETRRSGISGVTEARFRRLDGQYRWFRSTFIPERNGQGGITRWFISNTDIDEIKIARARGRQSRDSLAASQVELLAPAGVEPNAELPSVQTPPPPANAAQLAREHLEALTRTVEALAMESSPDRLVEHVLRAITSQFQAHSCAVWTRDSETSRIGFECALESGIFIGQNHPKMTGVSPWIPSQSHWPWLNLFRTGRPELIDDVSILPQFDMRDHLMRIGVVSILMMPMSIAATIKGGIGIRFSHKRVLAPGEIELAQAFANHAMLALQLYKLYAHSRESAVTAERNRMARDIHDTIAQGLTGVIVQLEASADARNMRLQDEADAHVERAKDLARISLQEARRSVRALRPLALIQNDWYRALSNMLEKMTEGTSLRVHLSVTGEQRLLPPGWDENLMRIGQEALTNALRYAHASVFRLQVDFLERQLVLDIKDDGRGFNTQARFEGYGLIGIRERVEQMVGALEVTSAPGKGTNLRVTLPLEELTLPPTQEDR